MKETVFLGVILDEHLPWKPHILSVSRKISKSIGIINFISLVFAFPKPYAPCTIVQGPKLTFLGRRQVATEIFFSVAI